PFRYLLTSAAGEEIGFHQLEVFEFRLRVLREVGARDATPGVAGAGDEAHERPVAGDRAGADKVQPAHGRLEAFAEHRRAVDAGDPTPQVLRQHSQFRQINLVSGRQQDVAIDPQPAVQLHADLIAQGDGADDPTSGLDPHAVEAGLDPPGRRRPQAASVDPGAGTVRHAVLDAGQIVEQLQRRRTDVRGYLRQSGKTPVPVSVSGRSRRFRPFDVAAADDLDVAAGLLQQRRRLPGALSASDHRYAVSAPVVQPGVLAAVAHKRRRQTVELLRPLLLAGQSDRDDDALGVRRFAVVERQAEALADV